jgi:hypothetical protein
MNRIYSIGRSQGFTGRHTKGFSSTKASFERTLGLPACRAAFEPLSAGTFFSSFATGTFFPSFFTFSAMPASKSFRIERSARKKRMKLNVNDNKEKGFQYFCVFFQFEHVHDGSDSQRKKMSKKEIEKSRVDANELQNRYSLE